MGVLTDQGAARLRRELWEWASRHALCRSAQRSDSSLQGVQGPEGEGGEARYARERSWDRATGSDALLTCRCFCFPPLLPDMVPGRQAAGIRSLPASKAGNKAHDVRQYSGEHITTVGAVAARGGLVTDLG